MVEKGNTGSPEILKPDPAKFWSKVDRKMLADCWPWLGSKRPDGYGVIKVGHRQVKAHRMAYLLDTGKDPDGLVVKQTCENKACCNPNHLVAESRRKRMVQYWDAMGGSAEKCRHGHVREHGKPCRTCKSEYLRKWRTENLERYREIGRQSYYRNRTVKNPRKIMVVEGDNEKTSL
jgi:hypothetical protein